MKKEIESELATWNLAYKTPTKTLSNGRTIGLGLEAPIPKVLVIDDDPLFRALVTKVAAKRNLAVTTCASVRELGSMAVADLFDVVIVDYFLDDLKQSLRGTDVAHVLESTPIVLISNNEYAFTNSDPWPTSIRKFVNKKAGVNVILNTALRLMEGKDI